MLFGYMIFIIYIHILLLRGIFIVIWLIGFKIILNYYPFQKSCFFMFGNSSSQLRTVRIKREIICTADGRWWWGRTRGVGEGGGAGPRAGPMIDWLVVDAWITKNNHVPTKVPMPLASVPALHVHTCISELYEGQMLWPPCTAMILHEWYHIIQGTGPKIAT